MYSKKELAARFRVSPTTITKYRRLGLLSAPVPPRGPHAAYLPVPHVEQMEAIWGHNGLKDSNRTLKDFAEYRTFAS